MKKSFLFVLFLGLFTINSCSKEEPKEQVQPQPTKYSLTITAGDGGSVSTTGGSYTAGTVVTVTATPSAEYLFTGWSNGSTENPLSISLNGNQTITANFIKRKYPLNIIIEGQGTVTEEVISTGKDYDSGTTVKLTAQAAAEWVFVGWTGAIESTELEVQLLVSEAKELNVEFKELEIQSIKVTNPIDTLVISRKHKYEVLGTYSNGTSVDLTSQVVLEVNDEKINLLDDNEFTVGKSGQSSLKIKYEGLELVEEFFINYFEEIEPHNFLKTPVSNSNIVVPVVIITYLPLKEGRYINQDTYPIRDYGDKIYDNLPVSEVQNWVLSNDIKNKYSIEEGSKYRNYNNSQSNPYLGIKVVKQYNFYEISKLPNPGQTVMSDGEEGWYPDYYDIFESIGLESLVNNHGVKEVWFNSKSLSIPESNMSSKLTGDISNSYRVPDDLPLYDNTYVVYGNFIHRAYAENIHNRGHQIEAQLTHIEKNKMYGQELFWNKFVGRDESGNTALNKRSGNTHFPPNGRRDYDYDNSQSVISDIGDWTPDNSGEKKSVNNQDWKFSRQLPVNLPDFNVMDKYVDLTKNNDVGSDSQGGWLIYWFQSIPGENNNISYIRDGRNYKLTNWWDLFYNWDNSINQNKTLWTNESDEQVNMYLDENGITIKAEVWAEVGDKGIINGVEYTVVDEVTLREMISENKDVTKVVTSKITNFASLFSNNTVFNQNIGNWDVSNVTNMFDTFYGTTFNQDISNWDVSNVSIMQGMFAKSKFNQPIGNWDVSGANNMILMFWDASIFNQDLSNWCVKNFTSAPIDFDLGATAWTLPKPVWGTCPE